MLVFIDENYRKCYNKIIGGECVMSNACDNCYRRGNCGYENDYDAGTTKCGGYDPKS